MFSIYQALKKYGVATTKNIRSNNKKDVEVMKMLLSKKSILFDPLNLFADTN